MNEERSHRFTDPYLTSTISTTSGLGSNYTSGSSNTQTTPSPRRKTSSNSFVDVSEIPEQERNDNSAAFYNASPSNYPDYRLANQSTHYFNRTPNYINDDNLSSAQRNYGYFGKENQ